MDIFWNFFGEGKELNALQMGFRAFLTFFITLILLRIAGIRTFGKRTAFDNVIIIMLGSVMSRVVVGASPFLPTCVACLVFVLIHWVLGKLSYYSDFVGRLVKGEESILYNAGELNKKNMSQATISKKDLMEGIRLKTNEKGFEKIDQIYLERNGEISIVRK